MTKNPIIGIVQVDKDVSLRTKMLYKAEKKKQKTLEYLIGFWKLKKNIQHNF